MILEILGHPFAYEMECLVRLFYPGVRIEVVRRPTQGTPRVVTAVEEAGGKKRLYARVVDDGFDEPASDEAPAGTAPDEVERRLGVLVFGLLCRQTGQRPAWGILTGVRPVRLFQALARERGLDEAQLRAYVEQAYRVQPEKLALALETARQQSAVLARTTPRHYSLYISIPFCPTRCLYCSFVSHAIDKTMRLVPDYVDRLCAEIRHTGALMRGCGHVLQTVYMGGGTPTTLTAEQLAQVLGTVRESFSLDALEEYTVEAGRPDTITPEKLAVLRSYGVGRVSINPQSMNDAVLRAIGRGHTVRQVVEGVQIARAAGFSCINMDVIAGLPGDTAQGFADSLEQVLALEPENLTVHTLTVKRSSTLRGQDGAFSRSPADMDAVLRRAQQRLQENGYVPYYLYRQKGTVQNLENTGFTKPGFAGLYNVYSMEETHTILAVGAGGVSKLCRGGEIQRIFNHKYPYEYLSRFDEILHRKDVLKEYTQCEI